MSDERDTAADDGRDDTVALTRPLRPTGKRSRQRTGGTALAEVEDLETTVIELDLDEDEDGRPVRKATTTDSGSTRNPVLFVWNYLKQVVAELRKVIWPNRKQMVNYTLVVLAFLVFMVALIGGVDLGFAKLVLKVFG